jgi:hypothetical protein
MAYCIYTAASVMMQDVKTGDIDANIKMQTFLHALRQGITTCPVVQRSLDIITSGLRADAVNLGASRMSNVGGIRPGESIVRRNYLPAFPYRDLDMGMRMDSNGPSLDLDGFSLLDSFPENHLDSMTPGEWFLPACE